MNDFKVKCTSSDKPNVFTAGRTYEVRDGYLRDNRNFEFGIGDFSSIEDVNEYGAFRGIFSFELVKVIKIFTKDDLKTGMEVLLRNGDTAYVVKDTGIGESDFLSWNNGHECLDLKDYDSALKFTQNCYKPSRYDIMKVYRGESPIQLFQKGECRNLAFDREKGIGCEPPTKEISVDEATKLLTEKFGQNVRIRVDD